MRCRSSNHSPVAPSPPFRRLLLTLRRRQSSIVVFLTVIVLLAVFNACAGNGTTPGESGHPNVSLVDTLDGSSDSPVDQFPTAWDVADLQTLGDDSSMLALEIDAGLSPDAAMDEVVDGGESHLLCDPVYCGSLGQECGMVQDECGNDTHCGPCAADVKCKDGICIPESCDAAVSGLLVGATSDVEIGAGSAFVVMGTSIRLLEFDKSQPPTWHVGVELPPWPRQVLFSAGKLYVLSAGRSAADCGPMSQCFRLHIFALLDNQTLELLGEAQWHAPVSQDGYLTERVLLNGTSVYIMYWGRGPYVVDVSDPASPVLLPESSPVPGTGTGTDMVLGSAHLFLADAYDGVQVFDVSAPLEPVQVGTIASPTGKSLTRMSVVNSLAFLVDSQGTASVVDVANPLLPELLAQVQIHDDPLCQVSDLHVAGQIGLVAGCCPGPSSPGYVKLLAIESLEFPSLMSELSFDSCPTLAIGQGPLVVSQSLGNVAAFDVGSPENPSELWETRFVGSVRNIAIDGTVAYAASDRGLEILDLSSPAYPLPLATSSTIGSGRHVLAKDETVWIMSVDGAQTQHPTSYLTAFDVSEPSSPNKNWEQLLPGNTRYLFLQHDNVMFMNQELSDSDWRFVRLSESDLGPAFQATGLAFPHNPTAVDSNGSLLVVAWSGEAAWPGKAEHGFSVFETDANGSVSPVTEYIQAGLPSVPGIALTGNRVYLAGAGATIGGGNGDELHIVNISTPGEPVVETVFHIGYSNISVHGNRAYLSDKGHAGFAVLDIAAPSAVQLLLQRELFFDSTFMCVRSGYAFLSAPALGVVDVRGCWGGE